MSADHITLIVARPIDYEEAEGILRARIKDIQHQAEEDQAAIWALCAICRIKVEHAAALARAKQRKGD